MSTRITSKNDSAQQFARGFAFCSKVLQKNASGRFVLPVEFWEEQNDNAEFCGEAICSGRQLVRILRFVGSCLTGSEQDWRDLRLQANCLQITK